MRTSVGLTRLRLRDLAPSGRLACGQQLPNVLESKDFINYLAYNVQYSTSKFHWPCQQSIACTFAENIYDPLSRRLPEALEQGHKHSNACPPQQLGRHQAHSHQNSSHLEVY